MTLKFAAPLTALLLLWGAPAWAGPAADAAAQADQLLADGKVDEALSAIEAAREAIWQAAPLTFRTAVFTAGEPQGYGIYETRASSTFKRSEPLVIYAEPQGFGYGRDGELYTVALVLDFTVTDAAGKEIASTKDFGTLSLKSRVPNKEFMAKVTYDFAQLPAGDYEVTTTARDQNGGKTGAFSLKFTLTD